MTRIKPTVSLFRVWQRELDGVLAHFSTTYTLYYCGYALALPWSSCYSRHVTHCDCLWCDHLWPFVTPLWYCDKVMWYFPVLHLVVVNKKRKEKKRNINNNLANLPSHDILFNWVSNICNILIYFSEWRLMRRAFLALAFISEALEVVNAILLSV